MSKLALNRHKIIAKLEAPARAAANAMKDAGMLASADPLLAIFFELDAADRELQEAVDSNPRIAVELFLASFGPGGEI